MSRKPFIVISAWVAMTAAALAQTAADSEPDWLHMPTDDEIAAAYPVPALARHIEGTAAIRCVAGLDTHLKGCTVVSEAPADRGFGAAALKLVPSMLLTPAVRGGKPVEAAVTIPVKFAAPPQRVITNPDWEKRPSPEDYSDYYPALAMEAETDGSATISCKVQASGLLYDCSVLSESPKGYDFGGSALALSSLFCMKPQTLDGTPVSGGTFVTTIHFSCECGTKPDRTKPVTPPQAMIIVYKSLPWLAAPSQADMAAAYPESARRQKLDTGRASLKCEIAGNGSLRACSVETESPSGAGFGRAARTLVTKFRAPTTLPDGKSTVRSQALISFAFPRQLLDAPATALGQVKVIQGPLPETVASAFPPQAKAAGTASGRANLTCQVSADGGLKDCKVEAESPANLGFGAAALSLTPLVKVNVWGDDGLPTLGTTAVLPFAFGDAAPPASASAESLLRNQIALDLASNRPDDAMSGAQNLLGRYPLTVDELEMLRRLRDRFEQANRYQDALKVFDLEMRYFPGDAEAFNQRCRLRMNQDAARETAMADCDRALALQPGYGPALETRGELNLKQMNYQAAIADLNAALAALGPNGSPFIIPKARYALGVAKLRAGDRTGNDDVKAALKISPNINGVFEAMGIRP